MNTSETVRLQVDKLLGKFNAKAVIFDLDGTLIDNNSYHLETWKKYLEKSGRSISDEEPKISSFITAYIRRSIS